jgi:hypothetical protein
MAHILQAVQRLVQTFVAGFFIALICLVPVIQAQDTTQENKAPFDPKNAKDGGLGMPSPFDKFLALNQVLSDTKLDWRKTFRQVAVDIDADAFTDKDVAIPMVLGVRIADGVMAVKACDAELLNKCASDIEKLAQKMGVKDSELSRARAARAAANNNEWLKVFMELGFLQQDIMQKIADKENSVRGDLLVVCGWMQGARYTTTIVGSHYTKNASNILREPLLAKALNQKVEQMPENVKKNVTVAKMLEVLPKMQKILTIPLDGSISKEDVAELKKLSTEVVKSAVHTAP